VLSKLADVATGNALISGGVNTAPSYGKIALTTHVSGTLPVANGGTGLSSGTSGGVLAYTAAGTLASSAALAANALVIGGGAGAAPSTTTTGTGVVTALGVNTGTAGAFVVNGGALGTPSSGTLTNATGLPISTGVSGLGTGIATALAVNVGTAGSPVVNGGALGTPSSGTVTNLTGTASININGTVGATTPTTVVATTVKASTTMGVGAATPSASGAGITFPATQSASSDVNTLDDYEIGTYTTTANANTTLDNGYRAFKYTKVGNVVNVVGLLQITGSTGTDVLTFTLPFIAAADQTNGQNRSVGGCLPSNATTGTVMVPFVQNNTAVLNLYKITLGVATNSSYAAATNADVINGSSINFNITYLTA